MTVVVLKATAKVAIERPFKDYSLKYGKETIGAVDAPPPMKKSKLFSNNCHCFSQRLRNVIFVYNSKIF
jgi:hypothetical protein